VIDLSSATSSSVDAFKVYESLSIMERIVISDSDVDIVAIGFIRGVKGIEVNGTNGKRQNDSDHLVKEYRKIVGLKV
jgi:hypothetical protein